MVLCGVVCMCMCGACGIVSSIEYRIGLCFLVVCTVLCGVLLLVSFPPLCFTSYHTLLQNPSHPLSKFFHPSGGISLRRLHWIRTVLLRSAKQGGVDGVSCQWGAFGSCV